MTGSANAAALYAEAFGFTDRPFTLVPDPETIYWSDQHKWAYSVLEYGILSAVPVTLLTGEIGAGKTTLLRELLGRLGADFRVGLISNTQGGRSALYAWILGALGAEVPQTKHLGAAAEVVLYARLEELLLGEYAAGRRVVLMIDEAQNLTVEALEQVRLLTNLNSGKDELIQVVLVGQPELRKTIRRPELRQLSQRVAANFHLGAMDEKTVAGYITHRLKRVGGSGAEFTPGALRAIHRASGGIPRLVNQICDFALLYAWSGDRNVVDEAIVALVFADGVFFAGGLAAMVEGRLAATSPAAQVAQLREVVVG